MTAREKTACAIIWILWTLAFPFGLLFFAIAKLGGVTTKKFSWWVRDWFRVARK